MRSPLFPAAAAVALSAYCQVTLADDINTSRLTLVEENHAALTVDKVSYTLDSYIIMFQQPYYILIRRDDKQPLSLEEAVPVAEQYIRPRGCTQPLKRRADLDRSNSDKTQLLIGFAC